MVIRKKLRIGINHINHIGHISFDVLLCAMVSDVVRERNLWPSLLAVGQGDSLIAEKLRVSLCLFR